jgi:uncharacterized membrane protein
MLLAWPFLIGFGLAHNSLQWLLPVMALVLLLRLRQARRNGPDAVCGAVRGAGGHRALRGKLPAESPPVAAVLPGGRQPCDAGRVRRFAVDSDAAGRTTGALREPNLPPEGVRYTRKVTLVWCGFFIGNGAMALFTVLHGDMHLWTLWNGMVAYILMGTLMAAEWLVRQRVIKRDAQ